MSVAKLSAVALALGAVVAAPAYAASYNFDVLYFGGGSTSLGGSSDNPTGQVINVGDDFDWTITAQGGAEWHVNVTQDSFLSWRSSSLAAARAPVTGP